MSHTQDGIASPNPSYPQEVKVVTGENTINVVGKNWFSSALEQGARSNVDGTTNITSNKYVRTVTKIKVVPNTIYYLSFEKNIETSVSGDIQEYSKDQTFIRRLDFSMPFTTTSETEYLNIQFFNTNGISTSDVYNIQLEKISTSGNIINPNSPYGTSNGITTTYDNNNQSLSFTGTTTGTWAYLTNKINVNIPKGEYTFSSNKAISGHTVIMRMYYNASQYQDITILVNTASRTITLTNDTIAYQILLGGLTSGVALNNTLLFQLKKGSSNLPSPYEPYQSQSYEINLGKNLFKNFSFTENDINGVHVKRNNDNTLSVVGTTTAVANCWINNLGIKLEPGTYTFSTNMDLTNKVTIALKDSGGTNFTQFNTGMSKTFTVTQSSTIAIALVQIANNVTIDNDFTFQIEKGSQATNYAPYFDPIELAKIEDYKDKIYKDSGKWYLHKEIGKVVDTGDEDWKVNYTGTANWFYYYNDDNITILNQESASYSMCDHYVWASVGSTTTSNGYFIVKNSHQIRIRYGTEDTVNNFKTWLQSNNVIFYYVLNTPTVTEITDENLISQLEAVKLLSGTQNNFTIDADTLPTLNLNYIGEANPYL